MKRAPVILSIVFCTAAYAHAQNPVFSQFYTSSLYLNPALAGMESDVVLALNYRSQWAGINLPFRTFQFSVVHPITQQGIRTKHLGGVGATVLSDEAGQNREVTTYGFSFASGYNFHLSREGNHLITTGLQFGVIQRRVNMDALQWSSQYNPATGYDPSLPGEQFVSERVTSPVINAGAMWRLTRHNRMRQPRVFYQGFAISNINRPAGFFPDGNDALSMLYKIHGGYVHAFNNGIEVSPNYLIQYQNSMQINIGAYAAHTVQGSAQDLKISLGVWYRVDDSFIITTGFSTSRWNAGFSYDANTSSFGQNFQGSNAFEVSFQYRIGILKTLRTFSTPLI